jgi:hypothetical protein
MNDKVLTKPFYVRVPHKISYYAVLKPATAVLVFIFSLAICPYYINGDQIVYIKLYEGLRGLNIIEGFVFYASNIDSKEFGHFFLSWLSSNCHIEKDLFIAISNAFLAYFLLSLFQKWRVSAIIAVMLITTNFYFIVLYFAAERLKFGVIFLVLSILYIDKIKRFYVFVFLSIISHIQMLGIYIPIFFNVFVKQLSKLFRTEKISRYILFIFPFLFIPVLLMADQIFIKIQACLNVRDLVEIVKSLLFFLLAFWYSKKKIETILLFLPLIIAVFLLGGNRLNMFGYFIFLYYALPFRGGFNFGVLATSAYFAYSSIGLIANIMEYGNGFFR